MLHNYKCKLYYKHKITFYPLINIQFLTLINYVTSNSVTVDITIWRNCEVRMHHASVFFNFSQESIFFFFLVTKLLSSIKPMVGAELMQQKCNVLMFRDFRK